MGSSIDDKIRDFCGVGLSAATTGTAETFTFPAQSEGLVSISKGSAFARVDASDLPSFVYLFYPLEVENALLGALRLRKEARVEFHGEVG